MKTQRNERIRLLNSVKGQVILVRSAYDGTKRLSEHSMVAEANHESGNGLPAINPDTLFTMQTATSLYPTSQSSL